jgi:hypothetical protein
VWYFSPTRHALYGLGMQTTEKFSSLCIIQKRLELRLFLHLSAPIQQLPVENLGSGDLLVLID